MDDVAGIFARESRALDRYVQIGVAQGRILSVDFPDRPQDDAREDHDLLDRIEAYLDGAEEDFSEVTVALTMSTAQRRALEAVREIPYGDTATVDQVARMTAGLDDEDDADHETVRAAMRNNPVPILVPDHRVVDAPGAAPDDVSSHCRRIEGL